MKQSSKRSPPGSSCTLPRSSRRRRVVGRLCGSSLARRLTLSWAQSCKSRRLLQILPGRPLSRRRTGSVHRRETWRLLSRARPRTDHRGGVAGAGTAGRAAIGTRSLSTPSLRRWSQRPRKTRIKCRTSSSRRSLTRIVIGRTDIRTPL